ncbi:hypothetical protein TNCV_1529031 [Trichonephila clavipes]|uniref:Uncharacterized protein n=1 Tax=Trichonephila clavipes TaxID=2585209 RepID=A0A8X6SHV8_TRICX|nr:hypothetical protein TNCV_1529031 [Trichonephila clavipes]
MINHTTGVQEDVQHGFDITSELPFFFDLKDVEVEIVRVHYFVRGGFVGYRSRASSKHLSPHSSGRALDSSGGSNRVCAASEVARVGVESTKKPTPDVVVVFET